MFFFVVLINICNSIVIMMGIKVVKDNILKSVWYIFQPDFEHITNSVP